MYFAYLQADFTEGGSLAVNGLLDIVGNLRVSGRNSAGHGRVQEGVKGCVRRLWEKVWEKWKVEASEKKEEGEEPLCIRSFMWLEGDSIEFCRLECIPFVLVKFTQEISCSPLYSMHSFFFFLFSTLEPCHRAIRWMSRKKEFSCSVQSPIKPKCSSFF